MSLKLDLFARAISDAINVAVRYLEIDTNEVVNTLALQALDEIRTIIHNDSLNDFEMVDEIVSVFEKYNICTGGRHDFG